jgi:hypothetical protein
MQLVPSPIHSCPCCGFRGLDYKPYSDWDGHVPPGAKPPYDDWLGRASYGVCLCCGYEFGFDDDPGNGPGQSFDEYRREWIEAGCQWFHPRVRPDGWDVQHQLRAAGISSA